jgi:hypothetical protein
MTILLIVCVGCMFWIYFDRQGELNHKQQQVNILWNYKLNEPGLKQQIESLEAKNIEIKNELEQVNIKYAADEKYIDVLESRYLRCEIYANTAELILANNGVEFTRNDN